MKKLIILLCLFATPAFANTLYYAGSTNGFYDSNINTSIPSDAVVITQATHDSLMAAQSSGHIIQNNGGQPQAVNPPAPSAAQVAQNAAATALANGIIVTSSNYPSLSGTYSVSPSSVANVNAVTTCILLNATFCNGNTTMQWADTSGTMHTFPTVAEFKSFATQFASYVAAVQTYADSGGTVGSIPSNTITLP